MSDALTKAMESQKEGPAVDSAGHCDWLAETCPLVHAMMTKTVHDGKKRKTSTVSVSFDKQDQKLKAALNDRDRRMSVFSTIGHPQEAFEALEHRLESGAASWRQWT